MTRIDARLSCLADGFYMYYHNSEGRKHMYIFELAGDDAYILRTMYRNMDNKVYILHPDRTYERGMLNQNRSGVIFKLTDDEYLLEVAREL